MAEMQWLQFIFIYTTCRGLFLSLYQGRVLTPAVSSWYCVTLKWFIGLSNRFFLLPKGLPSAVLKRTFESSCLTVLPVDCFSDQRFLMWHIMRFLLGTPVQYQCYLASRIAPEGIYGIQEKCFIVHEVDVWPHCFTFIRITNDRYPIPACYTDMIRSFNNAAPSQLRKMWRGKVWT